ncbi:MAG: alkaline phosphatase [Acidobacteriota bacterium]
MKRLSIAFLFLSSCLFAAEKRATNVILFLGDAAGIPTLNAASIHGYKAPQKLFVQRMPHQGLMDTSSASSWVTDSAAAMSAIVTGQKTDNGVISETALSAAGGPERKPLKTILEYAEEHGLSTGVISNSPMADATPAACYAHVDERSKTGEIFSQILNPRFGDGIDLVIGPGRKQILTATATLGIDLEPALRKKGYAVYDSLDAVPDNAKRVVALFESDEYDLGAAIRKATTILSRNSKGFFLMVESDLHTDQVRQGLDRAVAFDRIIEQTVQKMKNNTLLIFAADHSFDFRVQSGRRDQPLLPEDPAATMPNVRMEDSHTGEEVLVAADGPGSERVHGFFPNTNLFHIMLAAFGWE